MTLDDDAPLSALAKAPKFDDDLPLSSLADGVQKPKFKPSTPKASPKAGGKGKGKQTPLKRKMIPSSSSSSSSDSESSSDSNAPVASKKNQKAPAKKSKMALLKRTSTAETMGEDGEIQSGGAVTKRDRSIKEQLVADLLCRWWYVMPDWPPDDEAYFQAELEKRNLRKVPLEEWDWEPEVDKNGRAKVYELSQFKGLFRDVSGELRDLRPKDSCPCFSNYMKKEVTELYDLLVVALENQLKDLVNSKYNESQLEAELKTMITRIRNRAYEAKNGTRR
jgi:hypothetical protein